MTENIRESASIRTLHLDCSFDAEPGQFIMLWLPDLHDEKPYSLSGTGAETSVSVLKRGRFSEALSSLPDGSHIWVRGPYGQGFEVNKGEKACVVAGGVGAAPMLPLIKKLDDPVVIAGFRSADEISFLERLRDPILTTDDGSSGRRGTALDTFREKVEAGEVYDCVYVCGPELMIEGVFRLCEKYGMPCQAGLERRMKCGFGLCGACAIDGYSVCRDGPVFSSELLRGVKDLGRTAKVKSGRKVFLNEYFQTP